MTGAIKTPVTAVPSAHGLFDIYGEDGVPIAENVPAHLVMPLTDALNYHGLLLTTLEALFTNMFAPPNQLQKAINETCTVLLKFRKL